ncbi:MAG: protein TolQ [Bdellovibrionales bacterium]|nr:protein TolQ [Bdellovibrionales bacterium]
MNFAWAQTNSSVSSINLGAWHAIISANLVVQIVLLALVCLSVVCWAIIFAKRKQLSAMQNANLPFEDAFWKANSMDDIYENLKNHPESGLANVFRAGYLELRKIADSNLAEPNLETTRPLLNGMDNLQRALNKAIDIEVDLVESRLNWLATTGSTGPFIGLFGTVWGIMSSFQKIGATGSASLAVVAPGLSEALIATAVGLLAAIPATVAYNYFISEIKKYELRLNNFSADFLNIAKRNFFR